MAPVSTATATAVARDQAKQQQASQPPPHDTGIMHYIDMVSQASDYILTHPVSDLANGLSLLAGLVTGNGKASQDALIRMGGWTQSQPVAALKAWTVRQLSSVSRETFLLQAHLTGLIGATRRQVEAELARAMAHERRRREAGDRAAERQARREVTALHHLIEREAAGAYRQGHAGRIAVITRLADYLAAHNSEVSGLLARLTGIVLDLAAVDDPAVRVLAGFLIRHVITRLGLDKVTARATADLLAPVLGNPHPRTLAAVIGDISARLGAIEAQEAQFWADGGAEVEQAGRQWSAITSPVVDIAIVAWLAQAATHPQAWARELSGAVEPVMTGAKDAMSAILREGQ